ncbi:MAG: prolipoprotein diacylglyceryl transferase [Lentisphaeria bacterium]|nr:MAG: prolipoprotein diacylglyceryl transferase [Lentisphaeria bacterium]
MHPILLQIGGFTLRSYGLMAAIGFLAAAWLLGMNRSYAKMSADQASAALFIAMIAGIVGARIFYVVQFFRPVSRSPLADCPDRSGGLVFYGGFLLAIAALWVYAHRQKLDIIRILDVCTPAIALAHACGRIGCFLNGCCYGKPTGLFWGVRYPAGERGGAPLSRRGAASGPALRSGRAVSALFSLFLPGAAHPAWRGDVLLSDFLRNIPVSQRTAAGDNPRVFELFTPAQLIGLAIIPAGVLLLVHFLRHGNQKLEFVITSGEAGTRLDRCLSRLIPDSSRSFLQKLIRDGMVRADGAAVDVPRYPVRAGMRIEVDLPEEAAAEPSPEPFDFPILYEDESMLVIDKPPGVVVHPAAGNPTGTVVNALLGRYPQLAEELACGNSRPGIVHRLDKDTSGCLVIAKTASAQFKLSGAFAGRETAKTYLALVRGVPKRPSGELSNLIGRHPVNRKKMAVVERCGKLAVTGTGSTVPARSTESLFRCWR